MDKYLESIMIRVSNIVFNARQQHSGVSKTEILNSLESLVREYEAATGKDLMLK